jgi:hypothetical protein
LEQTFKNLINRLHSLAIDASNNYLIGRFELAQLIIKLFWMLKSQPQRNACEWCKIDLIPTDYKMDVAFPCEKLTLFDEWYE